VEFALIKHDNFGELFDKRFDCLYT